MTIHNNKFMYLNDTLIMSKLGSDVDWKHVTTVASMPFFFFLFVSS